MIKTLLLKSTRRSYETNIRSDLTARIDDGGMNKKKYITRVKVSFGFLMHPSESVNEKTHNRPSKAKLNKESVCVDQLTEYTYRITLTQASTTMENSKSFGKELSSIENLHLNHVDDDSHSLIVLLVSFVKYICMILWILFFSVHSMCSFF